MSGRQIESFREAIWAAEECLLRVAWHKPRIVFLIDEFSYLYGYLKEGRLGREFMRQWKALIDIRAFAAVLVGQDTMPAFIAEYPNEFGVTSVVRMSYLSREDACSLADLPIRLDGMSRYRGAALETLIELTAGSPFYTQIFCNRLVNHLNSTGRILISEVDRSRTNEPGLRAGYAAGASLRFTVNRRGRSRGSVPERQLSRCFDGDRGTRGRRNRCAGANAA